MIRNPNPNRRTADDRRKPLARYGAIGARCASGLLQGSYTTNRDTTTPEVECIGKGKARRPYEFGVKVSLATTFNRSKGGQFIAHAKALPGNPYTGTRSPP